MMTYAIPLIAIVLLCAGWAVFQLWLLRHDPDINRRSLKCGECGCEKPCDEN